MHLSSFQNILLMSFIGLSVCISTANCSNIDKSAPQPLTTKQEMKQIQTEIKQLIGAAICTDNNQCKSLAIGAKACGGPVSYLAYSTLKTNVDKLTSLGVRLKGLHQRYNKEEGIMSDCMMVMPPAIACANNTANNTVEKTCQIINQ